MDSLEESVPKLGRNITLGTQIENETGVKVTRVTDYTDDDSDSESGKDNMLKESIIYLDSLPESVPKIGRNITLGTQIEQEVGIPVTRVTDYTDDYDVEEEADKDIRLEHNIRPIRQEMRDYLNSEVGLRKSNPAGKYFSLDRIKRLNVEIQKLKEYHNNNPNSRICNSLINQLTNLKNEFENKIIKIYGSLSGGLKKRSKKNYTNKRRHTNKKRGNKRRHTMKKRRNKRRQTSRKY